MKSLVGEKSLSPFSVHKYKSSIGNDKIDLNKENQKFIRTKPNIFAGINVEESKSPENKSKTISMFKEDPKKAKYLAFIKQNPIKRFIQNCKKAEPTPNNRSFDKNDIIHSNLSKSFNLNENINLYKTQYIKEKNDETELNKNLLAISTDFKSKFYKRFKTDTGQITNSMKKAKENLKNKQKKDENTHIEEVSFNSHSNNVDIYNINDFENNPNKAETKINPIKIEKKYKHTMSLQASNPQKKNNQHLSKLNSTQDETTISKNNMEQFIKRKKNLKPLRLNTTENFYENIDLEHMNKTQERYSVSPVTPKITKSLNFKFTADKSLLITAQKHQEAETSFPEQSKLKNSIKSKKTDNFFIIRSSYEKPKKKNFATSIINKSFSGNNSVNEELYKKKQDEIFIEPKEKYSLENIKKKKLTTYLKLLNKTYQNEKLKKLNFDPEDYKQILGSIPTESTDIKTALKKMKTDILDKDENVQNKPELDNSFFLNILNNIKKKDLKQFRKDAKEEIEALKNKANSIRSNQYFTKILWVLTLGVAKMGLRQLPEIQFWVHGQPKGDFDCERVLTATSINKAFKLEFYQNAFKIVFLYSSDASSKSKKSVVIEELEVFTFFIDLVNQYRELLTFENDPRKLEALIKELLLTDPNLRPFFFNQFGKLSCAQVFEKNIIDALIQYSISNKQFNWLYNTFSGYYKKTNGNLLLMTYPVQVNYTGKIEKKGIDFRTNGKLPTNNRDNFIKIIESLNITRLNILNFLCNRKTDFLTNCCVLLKDSQQASMASIDKVALDLRENMFNNKDHFMRIGNIIEKVVALKTLLSYNVIPISHFKLGDSITNFEEKYGRFGTANRMKFDIGRAFHESLISHDL